MVIKKEGTTKKKKWKRNSCLYLGFIAIGECVL